MAKGSGGIKVDFDEITNINKQLAELSGALAQTAKDVGQAQPIDASNFAGVDTSKAAGTAAADAEKQISQAMQQAEDLLHQFTASLKSVVDQHQRDDHANRQTFDKQTSEVN